jgi:hypothetical protein
MVLTKERMMGAKIKAITPWTAKPGTRIEAIQRQSPLTTSIKAPRVKMVAGKDRIKIIGLIKVLTKPMTIPAIMATGKLANFIPGKI